MNYFAAELHCHTMHSDGDFTLQALCSAAKAYGFDLIALSDHNTMAAFDGDMPDFPVIKGIEWTTFFGHMLVLGASSFVDWREATPNNIDSCIEKIKARGGVVGLAHPFAPGAPMCTGGYWEFNVKNWHNVNYIEIWSGASQSTPVSNQRAVNMWTTLLDKGYKISATYGRDWHRLASDTQPYGCTYLGVQGNSINSELAKQALECGRTAITIGPLLTFEIAGLGKTYHIGDSIKSGEYKISFTVDLNARKQHWQQFNINTAEIRLITNGGKACFSAPLSSPSAEHYATLNKGWYRAELWGSAVGSERCIAITSPIYVE